MNHRHVWATVYGRTEEAALNNALLSSTHRGIADGKVVYIRERLHPPYGSEREWTVHVVSVGELCVRCREAIRVIGGIVCTDCLKLPLTQD